MFAAPFRMTVCFLTLLSVHGFPHSRNSEEQDELTGHIRQPSVNSRSKAGSERPIGDRSRIPLVSLGENAVKWLYKMWSDAGGKFPQDMYNACTNEENKYLLQYVGDVFGNLSQLAFRLTYPVSPPGNISEDGNSNILAPSANNINGRFGDNKQLKEEFTNGILRDLLNLNGYIAPRFSTNKHSVETLRNGSFMQNVSTEENFSLIKNIPPNELETKTLKHEITNENDFASPDFDNSKTAEVVHKMIKKLTTRKPYVDRQIDDFITILEQITDMDLTIDEVSDLSHNGSLSRLSSQLENRENVVKKLKDSISGDRDCLQSIDIGKELAKLSSLVSNDDSLDEGIKLFKLFNDLEAIRCEKHLLSD